MDAFKKLTSILIHISYIGGPGMAQYWPNMQHGLVEAVCFPQPAATREKDLQSTRASFVSTAVPAQLGSIRHSNSVKDSIHQARALPLSSNDVSMPLHMQRHTKYALGPLQMLHQEDVLNDLRSGRRKAATLFSATHTLSIYLSMYLSIYVSIYLYITVTGRCSSKRNMRYSKHIDSHGESSGRAGQPPGSSGGPPWRPS